MDMENADLQDNPITKIEDIIDIQKANGNINVRQVAFRLPSETDSSLSAGVAKSLETGLSKAKSEHKKKKKLRSKGQKSLLAELVSWPSDSDITVLRMKLYTRDKNMGNIILGDGLHQPDSSSMVNLATLILKSQPPSKQSLVEEYLLPLTSWEHAMDPNVKVPVVKEALSDTSEVTNEVRSHHARCSQDSEVCESNTKSKVARFLRLYFCPCCTCLYKLERMQEEPSTCFTKP
ncbi:uncharacterized protein LOC123865243 [Maniola jurtina]|uniref:uncharacterized protein LOC123865243 n=1 Tax=Maniola jurtina TaxID=191418 RepID=UPI001E68D648|nr:uncharacterized protein LOC123865243 [Maniola jurtina]